LIVLIQAISEHERRLQLPGIERRWFYKIAQYFEPYEHTRDIWPDNELLNTLRAKRVDLFSFIQRSFLEPSAWRELGFYSCPETIGLLRIQGFDAWLKSLPGRERTVVRKAERTLKTHVVDVDEEFVQSAYGVYNETPIRQRRRYSGFGMTVDDIRLKFSNLQTSEVIGTYLDNKLIGLMWVELGDQVAAMMSFISLISQRNKNPNNALIAEGVRLCDEKGYHYLTYGNMGYNPGLDFFKKNNGFKRVAVPRYFVPLSYKGQLAVQMKLCRPIERSFSPTLTRALIPFYNAVNRVLPTSSGNPADA
jgi:hypothetical protein